VGSNNKVSRSRTDELLVVDNPFHRRACLSGGALGRRRGRARPRSCARRQRAFPPRTVAERGALCSRVISAMERHTDEIAADIARMMASPSRRPERGRRHGAPRAVHDLDRRGCLKDVSCREDGLDRASRGCRSDGPRPPAWNYPLLTCINVLVPRCSPATPSSSSIRQKPLCRALRARVLVAERPRLVQASSATTRRRSRGRRRARRQSSSRARSSGATASSRPRRAASSSDDGARGNDPAYVAADCDLGPPWPASSTAPSTTRSELLARSSASTCTARATRTSSPRRAPRARLRDGRPPDKKRRSAHRPAEPRGRARGDGHRGQGEGREDRRGGKPTQVDGVVASSRRRSSAT